MTKMKDSDIIDIWRKHQEVHAFANELLNIERKICAEIADKHEKKHELRQINGKWEWISPAGEAIRERIK
jgi:hypothetical protein